MQQNARRNPCRPFNPDLIDDYLGKRKVISAQRLTSGKNNTAYKLRLSDGEVCVLKLYASDKGVRERYLMDLAAGIVPVPEVLHSGESWTIFSFISGRSLSDAPEYTGAAAEMIKHLASCTFPAPGEIHPGGSVSAFTFGGIVDFICKQLNTREARGWLGEKLLGDILKIVSSLDPVYQELEKHACLVHGDFNPNNILINNNNIAAILDWEYCHSGSPYMDLGCLLRHTPMKYHKDIGLAISKGPANLIEDWYRKSIMVDLSSQLEYLTSTMPGYVKQAYVEKINLLTANLYKVSII